jgi:hypothetical protein
MVHITNIRYRDIARAERDARVRLRARIDQIEHSVPKGRLLSDLELAEQARLRAVHDAINAAGSSELCDRLFVATRDLFNASPGLLGGYVDNHVDGVLRGFPGRAGQGDFTRLASCHLALTLGLLMIDGADEEAPIVIARPVEAKAVDIEQLKKTATEAREAANTAKEGLGELEARLANAATGTEEHKRLTGEVAAQRKVVKDLGKASDDADKAVNAASAGVPGQRQVVAETRGPGWATLSRLFYAAVGETQSMSTLAMLVLPILAMEGDPRGSGDASPGTVDAAEFARVMRRLADSGVTAEEPQLRRRVNEALNAIQNRGADGTQVTELGIDIPDFEDLAEASIVPENVRATGVFLCGAMFDELKVFEVVDKLVELFQNGMLTRTGAAGPVLYKYWKDAATRMSDGERRNFYALTMGIPGGDGAGLVNREFNDLWLRFVSSVSSFVRQNEVERLLRAPVPAAISQQQVRKAARDIAANLSAHGYGMVVPAALDLQGQMKGMMGLLSDPDIMSNYGARDMWQVVDQVATLELGGAKTSSRYRVLATCGAIITAWLANNADRISRTNRAVIDMEEVRMPPPRIDGSKATTNPSDWDLVNACELWLADTGTGDSIIDQMSQPRETPAMTSRPVQIPAIAREMLADLPGMGMSYAHTRH